MKQRPTARIDGDALIVSLPYDYRAIAGQLDGAQWMHAAKSWRCEPSRGNIGVVLSIAGIQTDSAVIDLARAMAPTEDTPQAGDATPVRPMPIRGVTPFAHQVAGYNLALLMPACALLWEQGTGKSLATVAVIARRWLDGDVKRVLIVAPLSVLPVWEREIEEYAAQDVRIPFTILRGTSQERADDVRGRSGVVAVNYESAWREPLHGALREGTADMVACDESRRIKDPQSKQSKGLSDLGRFAKYRMILTGTPVLNGPLDFWGQYRFLDPTIFGGSYYAFRARHAIMGGFENKQVIAYRHLDELVVKAHSIATRVTKASALDLPETLDEMRYCDLESKARKAYRSLRDNAVAALDSGEVTTAPQMIVRIMRLQQLTGGWLKPDEDAQLQRVSTAKRDALQDLLEDLEGAGKKVVIFARFLAEVADIVEVAAQVFGGTAVVTITGSVDGEKRGQYVRAFQTDPGVRVFVAQTATAGLGITLTASDSAIFYSCDYSYANHEQARARIHRIGQRNACTYYYMVARDTVDEDILEALKSKKGLAETVVDDWRKLLTRRGGN